ncbi:hypothetical protein NMY22_g6450 [Coprinellus aureogranulatus]|nr:hypothetical protein NMY22_g6450 [Coprinellus aureogranulatus]
MFPWEGLKRWMRPVEKAEEVDRIWIHGGGPGLTPMSTLRPVFIAGVEPLSATPPGTDRFVSHPDSP